MRKSFSTTCLIAAVVLTIAFVLPAASAYPVEDSRTSCGTVSNRPSPCIADIDGDGKEEILCGDGGNVFNCYNCDGSLRWARQAGGQVASSAAAWDVNGDGKMEIFVGDLGGFVWGFDAYGNTLPGWPVDVNIDPDTSSNPGVFSSPSIGDLDNDGDMEIVFGSWSRYVWAMHHDGQRMANWPVFVRDTVWCSPAIGDVNLDGFNEVVIGCDCTHNPADPFWPYGNGGLMHVFDRSGNDLTGWPKWIPEVIWSSPALADLNGDGLLDIIVGTGNHFMSDPSARCVYAWNYIGQDLPGWPAMSQDYVFASPGVGDVNGDGSLEVAAVDIGLTCSSTAYIWSSAGQQLSSSAIHQPMASPAIGDVNGDNLPEVLYDCYNAPALGDFDKDGTVDIARFASNFDNTLTVQHTGAQYNPDRFPWPMFRHDCRHTGNYGAGEPPPPPPPAANFETYVVLQNPNPQTANATLTFMMGGGETKTRKVSLTAGSRSTVLLNDEVGFGKEVSTSVSSDLPIVCERPTYFDYQGMWPGGHDVIGASEPAQTFYFAEGTCRPGFCSYLCIQNPNGTASNVKVTYMKGDGSTQEQSLLVPANSRTTVSAKDALGEADDDAHDFSSKVETVDGTRIICERPIYFNYKNKWPGGHNVVGALSPEDTWYFAEGTCRPNFEPYLCIQNPNDSIARVRVTYMKGDGSNLSQDVDIDPNSRYTVVVKDILGEKDHPSHDFSARVECVNGQGIICERPIYFNYQGYICRNWAGGHNVVGALNPSESWYFAEGTCRPDFDAYICVQNPNPTQAQVAVTYMLGNGTTQVEQRSIPQNSRATVIPMDFLGVANDEAHDFSASIQSTNGQKIICERPLYFNYQGSTMLGWQGGHDTVGISNPSTTWYFAEGYTGQ